MKGKQVLAGNTVFKSIRQASYVLFGTNRINQIKRAIGTTKLVKGISFEFYDPNDGMSVEFYNPNNKK